MPPLSKRACRSSACLKTSPALKELVEWTAGRQNRLACGATIVSLSQFLAVEGKRTRHCKLGMSCAQVQTAQA